VAGSGQGLRLSSRGVVEYASHRNRKQNKQNKPKQFTVATGPLLFAFAPFYKGMNCSHNTLRPIVIPEYSFNVAGKRALRAQVTNCSGLVVAFSSRCHIVSPCPASLALRLAYYWPEG